MLGANQLPDNLMLCMRLPYLRVHDCRPKPETLQRRLDEARAERHSRKGRRGAARMDGAPDASASPSTSGRRPASKAGGGGRQDALNGAELTGTGYGRKGHGKGGAGAPGTSGRKPSGGAGGAGRRAVPSRVGSVGIGAGKKGFGKGAGKSGPGRPGAAGAKGAGRASSGFGRAGKGLASGKAAGRYAMAGAGAGPGVAVRGRRSSAQKRARFQSYK